MAGPDKKAPPASDPRPGRNPGYPEPQPRDPDDAQQPHPRKPRNPDDGGLGREPDTGQDPAND